MSAPSSEQQRCRWTNSATADAVACRVVGYGILPRRSWEDHADRLDGVTTASTAGTPPQDARVVEGHGDHREDVHGVTYWNSAAGMCVGRDADAEQRGRDPRFRPTAASTAPGISTRRPSRAIAPRTVLRSTRSEQAHELK